jgi:hypothetical protein
MMIGNLFKSLRPKVIAFVVVIWNALCLSGIWLNGGATRIQTRAGCIAMAFTCALLSIVCFATAQSEWWQTLALRPMADPHDSRPGLLLISVLAALLAIGFIFGMFYDLQ